MYLTHFQSPYSSPATENQLLACTSPMQILFSFVKICTLFACLFLRIFTTLYVDNASHSISFPFSYISMVLYCPFTLLFYLLNTQSHIISFWVMELTTNNVVDRLLNHLIPEAENVAVLLECGLLKAAKNCYGEQTKVADET